ncbi:hypothetical protein NR756_06635 [Alloalcanivorax xenomutans]|uniref:hypothetical protein n=1 Tax=Alloalcanivorax xenomutans TaxID=1094342 RepID=UPI003A7FE551
MRKFILVTMLPLFLAACDPEDQAERSTDAQQEASKDLWDMGESTDRSKNKGF